MKYFITFFLFFFSFYLSAQTFLGPTIGYDFASLKTNRILIEGVLSSDGQRYEVNPLLIERGEGDTPSRRRSIAFGFQAQKMLSNQWSLGLRGNYSRKEFTELIIESETSFIIPEYDIFYHQIGISVLIIRKIKEKLSIGFGPNISYFSGWNSALDKERIPSFAFVPYQVTKRTFGVDLQIGYYLGPVYLAADYTRSLKVVDSSGYLKGASNLAVSGTYFFELKKRK